MCGVRPFCVHLLVKLFYVVVTAIRIACFYASLSDHKINSLPFESHPSFRHNYFNHEAHLKHSRALCGGIYCCLINLCSRPWLITWCMYIPLSNLLSQANILQWKYWSVCGFGGSNDGPNGRCYALNPADGSRLGLSYTCTQVRAFQRITIPSSTNMRGMKTRLYWHDTNRPNHARCRKTDSPWERRSMMVLYSVIVVWDNEGRLVEEQLRRILRMFIERQINIPNRKLSHL